MKLKLFFIWLLLLVVIPAQAYDFSVVNNSKTIYYKINSDNNSVSVTYKDSNYNSYSGSVTIPATVTYSGKTYSVNAIDEFAFCDCSSLTSVIFSDKYAIKSIGGFAFSDCTKLTNITIPYLLETIDVCAFYHCSALTSINIPYFVKVINNQAFDGCSSLSTINIDVIDPSSITFGNNLSYIFYGISSSCILNVPSGTKALYSSNETWSSFNFKSISEHSTSEKGLKLEFTDTIKTALQVKGYISDCLPDNLSIPETFMNLPIVGIYKNSFNHCLKLTSVNIPNTVTTIGLNAFTCCSNLTSVTLPENITILDRIFGSCTSLTSVTIPASVTRMWGTFDGCSNLKEVIFAENSELDWIDGTFNGCSSLQTIILPSKLTNIDGNAFTNCSALSSINTPSTVNNIYPFAFSGTGIYNNNENWEDGILYYGSWLLGTDSSTLPSSITIKNGISCIVNSAFQNTNLKNINLPNSLIGIGAQTFQDCYNLKSIIIPTNVKFIGSSAFQNCKNLTAISIPKIDYIGSEAFYHCDKLENINISKFSD